MQSAACRSKPAVSTLVLEPDASCPACDRDSLVTRSQRHRGLQLLERSIHLVAKLAECVNPGCPQKGRLISPTAELHLAPPKLSVGWDVFSWIGHKRVARDWRVGQIREELREHYRVILSDDTIERHIAWYEAMLAERESNLIRLRRAYCDTQGLILTIDGLQPEKGHETLYVIRELTERRVLFAVPLLSSAASEVEQLFIRARELAASIRKPVLAWMSDKQDAFVTGIASVFPNVPHRYCANHFLRDAAKPVLDADAHAKVQMRRKVRGLRAIEREILSDRMAAAAPLAVLDSGNSVSAPPPASAAPPMTDAEAPAPAHAQEPPSANAAKPSATSDVVLDYCSSVRGILNDDQGGPLHPPGVRMAEALLDVRASLGRLIDASASNPSRDRCLLERLAGCIDRGVGLVEQTLAQIRGYASILSKVQDCLEPLSIRSVDNRKRAFKRLARSLLETDDPVRVHIGKTMESFSPGLFVGSDIPKIPADNLDLERAFKHPKRHRRRIHGRAHAGAGLVQGGATLLLALDAHLRHPTPFMARELIPYRKAMPPKCQRDALKRRTIMRKSRSTKKRAALLASLEDRYLNALAVTVGSK
jgi:hypothetical protein